LEELDAAVIWIEKHLLSPEARKRGFPCVRSRDAQALRTVLREVRRFDMTNRYREITKGVPAHLVARVLNSFMLGHNWTGCSKSQMEAGYNQYVLTASRDGGKGDPEARAAEVAVRLNAEVLDLSRRRVRREAERATRTDRGFRCRNAVARLKDLGVACTNDGNGRVGMSAVEAEALVRLIERLTRR
jgi:hypothetical protein